MISRRQNTELGIVITLVFLLTGLVTGVVLWYKLCVLTLLIAILLPIIYTPLSICWFGLSRVVESLFSTIILALIFYLIVTPVALIRRYISEDTLRLRSFKKQQDSVFTVKDKLYKTDDLNKQY